VRKFKKTKTNKEKQSNEKLEDTKAGIRSQKSKTERQYNDSLICTKFINLDLIKLGTKQLSIRITGTSQ
jgi:hypothetical protein